MRICCVLTATLMLTAIGFSATIYVPDDHPTIQEALNAAVDGDTIIVRAGRYSENIDFSAKAVNLRSEAGPDATVIDGNQSGIAVAFDSRESRDSIIDGFSITNSLGSGIYCYNNSSPTIINNIIFGNNADHGGGIGCVKSSSPAISKNIIQNNNAIDGGGIYLNDSMAIISNNIIANNTASGDGGGIFCDFQSGTTITGSTISDNSASDEGGGIYCDRKASAAVINTILWFNAATIGPEISMRSISTLGISHSDVTAGQTYVFVESGCTLSWGPGMIDADPLFIDAAGGDYHLTWDSSCRDVGDNSSATEPTDFEGDPRIKDANVDMGADEFHTHLYHVGAVIPGSSVEVKVVGYPGTAPLTLALGSGLLDPPQQTPYGGLYIVLPPLQAYNLGGIPLNGFRIVPATIPPSWQSGERYHFQALVGPRGNPGTVLTNLLSLEVE